MKWKRNLVRAGAVLAVLIIMLVAGVGSFLRTARFHRYVLAKIMEQGAAATGGSVQVQNFDFHLSSLTANLYNVTLRGTETGNLPPLLQIDRITVGVTSQSLLHRKFTLSALLCDRPVIHLLVDRQGQLNLPTPRQKPDASGKSIFDLAVAHSRISGGEIYYNDNKVDVDADLYGLASDIHFEPAAVAYTGSISYTSGTLKYAGHSPVSHSLNANFRATRSEMSLDPLVLTIGSSRLSSHINILDYSSPQGNGGYVLSIHTGDFASLSPQAVPRGDVILSGTFQYRGGPDQSLLRTISTSGEMTSNSLQVVSPQGQIEFRQLRGQYQLANANLTVRDFAAEVLGGRLISDFEITHLDSSRNGHFQTKVEDISLFAAKQASVDPEIRQLPVTGTLSGTATGSWKSDVESLQALSDLRITAAVSSSAMKPPTSVPIEGLIHLKYDRSSNIVTLRESTLRLPSALATFDGQISSHSNLRMTASTGDLGQLAKLATAFQSAKSPDQEPIDITGEATLNAIVQGSLQQLRVSGQVDVRDLTVQGSRWSALRFGLTASPSELQIQDGSLVSAQRGSVTFSGQVGLRNWAYEQSSPISARLSAQQFSIAALQGLTNQHYPVEGDLYADIEFQGSELNPSGHGTARITKAQVYGEPMQTIAAQFRAADGTATATLRLDLPAGSANATVAYTPSTKRYRVQLNAPSIGLQRLKVIQARNLDLSGTLSISASGDGTLDDPQLTSLIQVPELQSHQKTLSHFRANVNIANQSANFVVSSDLAAASVSAHGKVNLTGDYAAEASLDSGAIPLGPLLRAYVPNLPAGLEGQTEIHATLKGRLKDKSQIEAHITIPTFNASYQNVQLSSNGPIHVDYANAVAIVQPASITGTGTDLKLEGRFPLDGTNQLSANAHGSIDLRIVSILDPDVQSSGTLALDVNGSGTSRDPNVRGQIKLQDVAFSSGNAPFAVTKLNGILDVTDERIQISTLTGVVGGGQVSAKGSILYRPSAQFNLALQGQSIRLLYTEGVRTQLEADLALQGSAASATLTGRILLDGLSFTPDFELGNFTSQFTGTSVPSSGPTFADNVRLDVAVQSSKQLAAVSSTASLEGQANLHVVGTASDPVIVGRADITSGELFFLNNRYKLERGILTFNNPNQTEPLLNVQATTTVQQYNLTLTLAGPLDKLRTNYASDPPLATADIINLIARGQTTEAASANSQSTDSILAGQVAGQFSSRVSKLAGISSLQIDPMIGGNNTNPSARVAIQQRVTRNFLFTFSTDVSQPEAEIIEGDYQINNRWSVSVARDQVGGVSVDGKYHTKF
jgi:translocation and assembly module TamB